MEKIFAIHNTNLPIYLEVASYNPGAISFYENLGFKVNKDKGEVKHELGDGKYIPVFEMVYIHDRDQGLRDEVEVDSANQLLPTMSI